MMSLGISGFLERSKSIHGDEFDYSDVVYVDTFSKVHITHKSCSRSFWQSPVHHWIGSGCPLCGATSRRKMSLDTLLKKFYEAHKDEYDYSKMVFRGILDKVEIICPKHGSFWQTPSKHLSGQGCPHCRSSLGEILVKNILGDLGLEFEQQKVMLEEFREGISPHSFLRADFYVHDPEFFIEYQGIQHFRPVGRFGWLKGFAETKSRDARKCVAAICCNVPLLWVDYRMSKSVVRERIASFVDSVKV
jgi:hypothetical protein